ncbi:DUF1282 domain-containing protein [Dysgonomonas sp. 216]|uniref:YIP1 family protein n=1 Tax=Dysgonomonas sp. 216 TaxID=2302934 RepID=UPI0013D23A38|nr:YIP1 family protein [Dysgonomonas sp. 216]NDW19643.1 DUF1282 domain-containing protein [Dysgonomonas sp. 216]
MIQGAFKSAIQVMFSPTEAWENILENKHNIYREFLFPIWGVILVLSFIGGCFFTYNASFELGVKNLLAEGLILFASFHISSFFMNEYAGKLTDVGKNLKKTQVFVAYSSSVIYLIEIAVALFDDLFFLWLFAFYTPYIVYIGAGIYYGIIPERRTNFMLLASAFILGMPLILKSGLSIIMNI